MRCRSAGARTVWRTTAIGRRPVELTITIEAAEGGPERFECVDGEWRLTDTLDEPWPVSYGFIAGTLNPADGEAWDAVVLPGPRLKPG